MKSIFLSIFLSFITVSIIAQNYDVRFNRTSVNCQTRQVCYDVQIRPNGSTPFNMAGQNWRIFWDATKATFVSGTSVLPTPMYTTYTEVQLVQNANADAKNGPLGFEANFGFLNYFMDLNDTNGGGILLPAGEWTTTSNLCFTVAQEVIDNPATCLEMVFARESLTSVYATAYVEVSRWVSSGVTTNSTGILYDDLNSSDGDQACFDVVCAISNITIADITVNEDTGNATVQVCIGSTALDPVTVTLNTSDGTAISPQDYTAQSNILVTIPVGETCTSVVIPITDDTTFESQELFNVTLTNPSVNATISDGASTVTIVDNDPACNAQAPVISGN
jgi:uncharacterized protein affecting Mg2+/Co2+ transport